MLFKKNIKIIFILFYFASSAFVLTSFNNNTHLIRPGNISNDSIDVRFSEIKIECLTFKENNFIVKNEQEYQKLLNDNLSKNSICLSYKLPSVNFSLNTVVGIITNCGGCSEPKIFKKIIKLPAEKKYLIQIFLIQEGLCKINFSQENWLLLPKIEEDYSVKFIINKK